MHWWQRTRLTCWHDYCRHAETRATKRLDFCLHVVAWHAKKHYATVRYRILCRYGICRARTCLYSCLTMYNPIWLPCRVKNLLYPLSVAAGICYGSMFSLVLALAGDLFGAEHIGTNYGLLDLGESVTVNWSSCSQFLNNISWLFSELMFAPSRPRSLV